MWALLFAVIGAILAFGYFVNLFCSELELFVDDKGLAGLLGFVTALLIFIVVPILLSNLIGWWTVLVMIVGLSWLGSVFTERANERGEFDTGEPGSEEEIPLSGSRDSKTNESSSLSDKITYQDLINISPESFEQLVADLYEAEGWHTMLTPASGDFGVDIKLYDSDTFETKGAVQCKRFKKGNLVSPRYVREITGVLHRDYEFAVLVTTSGFTGNAWVQADGIEELTLVNGEELLRRLNEKGFRITEREGQGGGFRYLYDSPDLEDLVDKDKLKSWGKEIEQLDDKISELESDQEKEKLIVDTVNKIDFGTSFSEDNQKYNYEDGGNTYPVLDSMENFVSSIQGFVGNAETMTKENMIKKLKKKYDLD